METSGHRAPLSFSHVSSAMDIVQLHPHIFFHPRHRLFIKESEELLMITRHTPYAAHALTKNDV